jgi:isoquinoline 1-oxidoreductase
MNTSETFHFDPVDGSELEANPPQDSDITRRGFLKVLGAGVVIAVFPLRALAQARRGGRGGNGGGGFGGSGAGTIAARVHIGKDGAITVMTGKVEGGQGARAEISQAAAEELRVPLSRVRLIMADTSLVPDDGITAGSGTTPRTIPAVRQGCAAARELLAQAAAKKWGVEVAVVEVRDGKALEGSGKREMSYADLAAGDEKALDQAAPAGVTVTTVKEWKVMGLATPRPGGRDLVTGAHKYPSDTVRPGMLYGKVLRAPSYGAKLKSVDAAPAKAMKDVVVAQEGDFVGVAAPTSAAAEAALAALAKTASWEETSHYSSRELYDQLVKAVPGGMPKNPFAEQIASAGKSLHQVYHVPYIQHAPLEPRAALAEWEGDKLTVWVGTQNPFGARGEVAKAMGLAPEQVHLIVPDFGGGFGGKHSPDAHVEAARLAKAAGKPVLVRWTREEEFTWACFRPAAVIDIEASLDAKGQITSWHFLSVNPGGSGVGTPYRTGKAETKSLNSAPPLRQSSYRCLGATANNFARESFMDELAAAAGIDPLEFRLAHLDDARMRTVLETAAKRFDWAGSRKKKAEGTGVGLSCGTEKGSYTAACAEVAVRKGVVSVQRVTQVFECGAVINPANMAAQVHGALIMGLGPVLGEAIQFDKGRITNAAFSRYRVARFRDVPQLDIHLLDRPDLPSAGGGETPIIAIAPAVANAVFHATGERIRQMPVRPDGSA